MEDAGYDPDYDLRMAERERLSHQAAAVQAGLREGIDIGRSKSMQAGFDVGYQLGLIAGLIYGEFLGFIGGAELLTSDAAALTGLRGLQRAIPSLSDSLPSFVDSVDAKLVVDRLSGCSYPDAIEEFYTRLGTHVKADEKALHSAFQQLHMQVEVHLKLFSSMIQTAITGLQSS